MSYPLRRRHLTVARAMVVVAIIALALGGVRWAMAMRTRARYAAKMTAGHASYEKSWTLLAREADRGELWARPNPVLGPESPWPTRATALSAGIDPDAGRAFDVLRMDSLSILPFERSSWLPPAALRAPCREKAAYHGRLRAKWARVTRFPWIGAEPDPPGPPLVRLFGDINGGSY